MQDQLNRNPLNVIGTPTAVAGALTVDSDPALSFDGPTSYASADDSTSLSITGSLSIECFLRLAAYPGSLQSVVVKGNSYGVKIDTTGHVVFTVVNGAASVTLTSNVALQTDHWYHLVCVYNGNYSGVARFGKTTPGSTTFNVEDDAGNNKAVGKFTLAESALLTSATFSLQYFDEIWPVQMRAVVYSDLAGIPDQLVTSSDVVLLNSPTPQWRVLTPVSFPLIPVAVPTGDYHIGYVADTQAGPLNKSVLDIGCDATGGTTTRRSDSVSGVSNPFGFAANTTTQTMAAYCDYTAISRTGKEGKALIYIDGALNVSAPYSGGIADTSNALQVCPALTAQVDELSIWNKALTGVQIATHYTAH